MMHSWLRLCNAIGIFEGKPRNDRRILWLLLGHSGAGMAADSSMPQVVRGPTLDVTLHSLSASRIGIGNAFSAIQSALDSTTHILNCAVMFISARK